MNSTPSARTSLNTMLPAAVDWNARCVIVSVLKLLVERDQARDHSAPHSSTSARRFMYGMSKLFELYPVTMCGSSSVTKRAIARYIVFSSANDRMWRPVQYWRGAARQSTVPSTNETERK